VQSRQSFFSRWHESLIFSLLTILGCFVLLTCVDMVPKVDENFFFAPEDPRFQDEQKISRLFERKDTQIIMTAQGDIQTPEYFERVRALSRDFEKLTGVALVRSVSSGPGSVREAQKSPLWRRLLVAPREGSTNIIVIIGQGASEEIVSAFEKIVAAHQKPGFRIRMSGMPYIVELIQRNLRTDFVVFSLIAYAIFGIIILLVFRSWIILWGTMIVCTNACVITLILCQLFRVQLGLLTANLITIVFVLAISHIIYLTYNWRDTCGGDQGAPTCVQDAVRLTFSASFWSMLTTLLGFASLLGVPARPLRELGISGVIGSLAGILMVYGIFPCFLRYCRPLAAAWKGAAIRQRSSFYAFLVKRKALIISGIFFFCLGAGLFLPRLNLDPSLLSYFQKEGEIARGLKDIDRSGGSSPLLMVVRSSEGKPLNTTEAYRKLWILQQALEDHPSVGTILSLPVLMAQARRFPLSFFFSWEWLLNALESPTFDEIGKSFITEDRQCALFLLRMKEEVRDKTRLEVIDDLKKVAVSAGMVPELIGGVYALQGHLSRLVVSSLIYGLGRLLLVFFLIGWGFSRSLKIAFGMIVAVGLIPLGILGTIGFLRIPLDIISAPASNIAISMGIDSMFHMVKHYRRERLTMTSAEAWEAVQRRLWKPIFTSMSLVALGFSIFLFSQFPPTQRFGFSIVLGTALAGFSSMLVMPLIAQFFPKFPPLRTLLRKERHG